MVCRLINTRIIDLQLFHQPLGGCLVKLPFGLFAGVSSPIDLRGKISLRFRTQMLPGRFPADLLFGPIVAVRHAVVMGDIKDGELAALIVHGRNPLRPSVHDRVFAFDNSPDLA